MNEQTSKGHNFPFIIVCILSFLLTAYYIFCFYYPISKGGNYMADIPFKGSVRSIYQIFMMASLWIFITVKFIKGKQIAWYLAVGYFIYLSICYNIFLFCYHGIIIGIIRDLSLGESIKIVLNRFYDSGFVLLLTLLFSILIVSVLSLKQVRKKFCIDLNGFFVKLLKIEVLLFILLENIPEFYWILFGSNN